MAETEGTAASSSSDAPDGHFTTPAPKSLKEIMELDKEDESLMRYKKSLLGEGAQIDVSGTGPKVTLKELALIVEEGQDDIMLDIAGDKGKTHIIKEGAEFKARLKFVVENDIVAGLKYVQTSSKLGVTCDTSTYMLGSYAPSPETREFTSRVDEFASGMLSHGQYTVHSKLSDDDGRDFISWDWKFEIKKDWK